MDELFALQQQLAEIQETSTKYRLSDRIIVDLIEKLVKEYDLKVYHSNDGQSLVTPNQLSKEIHGLIKSQQRVAVNQLPEKLGFSYDKIEGQIEKDSNTWDIVREQDELLSKDYIQTICEEINEDLQQRSIITLQEIMQKYQFSMQFIKKHITTKVGEIIQGVITEDKLTTVTFIEIITAKIRGILRASLTPISFIKLNKELEIANSQKICEQLINNKQLDGKIVQGQFISNKFLQNQEQITKKLFEENSYIEYDVLSQQLLINKPKEYLKQLFHDNVVMLDSCGFNKTALITKQEQIQELLIHEGYTNLQEILPVILSDQDIETLFQLMELNNCEFSNFLIYYKPYLDNLTAAFKDKIIESIYQNPQKLIEQQQQQQQQEDQETGAQAGGFQKKNKKQQQQKKKPQQKNDIFTQKEVFDLLIQKKLLEYNDCKEELYQFLMPRLQILYDSIKSELFENKKSVSSQVIQEIQKKIEDMALGILLTQRSLQKIQQDCHEVNTKVLVDNCLFGYRLLVENIVVITCKKYNIQLPINLFVDNNNNQNQQILNFGMQKCGKVFNHKISLNEAIQFLPKELSKVLKEMMDLYTKKSIDELAKNQYFDSFNLKVTLDKKNDKNLLYFVKHHCKEEIKNQINDKLDINTFNQILLAQLTDLGLFFIGNYDLKFYQALQQIVYELVQNQQIKKLIESISNSATQQLEITADVNELIQILKLI